MSWYKDGVVTLTNGSKAVTGVGTGWVDNVLPASIFMTPAGMYEIDDIVSDTSLLLVDAYTGPTVSGIAYKVIPTQGYVPPMAKKLTQLLTGIGQMKDAYAAGDIATVGDLLERVSSTELALATGAASVGTPEGTAQVALERRAVSVFSVVQLRALKGLKNGTRISMHQYRDVLVARPTGGGDLYVDRNDTTTPDDGAITFIMADGARAKRIIRGRVWASWWGTYGDGGNSDSAQIQKAVTFVGDTLELLFDPEDVHLFTTPVYASARLNARSESVKGLVGTTTFDGGGLPDNEYCLYLGKPYSQIKGIKFNGRGRRVNGICPGFLQGSTIYASHATVIESCDFVECRSPIASKYACHVRVKSCKMDACYKGFVLDATSNTWKITDTVMFNFLAAYSHSLIHVIDADQVTIRDLWAELNSVPVVIAERFTNVDIGHAWIEHLVAGNASPLFIVNGSTLLNPYNFVVHDTNLITNHPVLATLTNLQNFELKNIRQAGLRTPNVLPVINCDNVDVVDMQAVTVEYIDSPPSNVNRIVVNGALKVIRDDGDLDIVPREYQNRVFDSSFKAVTSLVGTGDVALALDTTVGVYDSSSIKIAFGAAGTGRVRTSNPIVVSAGQHVRVVAHPWSDSDTLFNQVALTFAGATGGKTRRCSLTKTPRRFDLTWQVPAGAEGAYYVYFNYSINSGALRAYNVWAEDAMVVVSDQPIPYIPYVMNNSLAAPLRIGTGTNLGEHTLMGRKISSAAAAPTSGTWARGDIVYNDNPAAGGFLGWICTATGAPGTWKTFGAITA